MERGGRPRAGARSRSRSTAARRRRSHAVDHLRDDLIPAAFADVPAEVYVTGGPAFNADFEAVDQRLHADRLRLRARPELPPADARLPLDRRADQGDRHEPALGRRGLRAAGAGLPEGVSATTSSASSRRRRSRPGCRSSSSASSSASAWTTTSSCSAGSASTTTRPHDNRESVAVGLQSTAKIITGAALIMVAVFGGFASRPAGDVPADGLRPGGRGPPRRHDRPLGPRAGERWRCSATATGTCRAGCTGCPTCGSRACHPIAEHGTGSGHSGLISSLYLKPHLPRSWEVGLSCRNGGGVRTQPSERAPSPERSAVR